MPIIRFLSRYKKNIIGVSLAGLFLCSPLSLVYSASYAEELQAKIDAQNAAIAKLEAEIASYKADLSKTVSAGQTLAGTIKELDLNQKKVETDIKVTLDKIKRTNLVIEQLGLQINNKKTSIKDLNKAIGSGMREIESGDHVSLIVSLLQEESLTSAWRRLDAIQSVQKGLMQNIKKLATVKATLEGEKVDTEAQKKEMVDLQNQLNSQKKIVLANKQEKQRLLKETKNQESLYKKIIADREKKKDQVEAEIRNYETQLKFVLDPSTLPGGGVLSWPLSKIIVTQRFGKTSSSGRLYASGTHNGADFGTPIGTPVYAMADGTVDGTGDTDVQCPRVSFGRFVLIRYKNGLASTFGHLSVISVSAGQEVHRGELVGYSGNTGYSTGPHLHVSVYANAAVQIKTLPSKSCTGRVLTQPIAAINGYLDPFVYLPPL